LPQSDRCGPGFFLTSMPREEAVAPKPAGTPDHQSNEGGKPTIHTTVEELAQAHLDLFPADQARLSLHAVRLFARGTLASLEQPAEASHFTREVVEEMLRAASIELDREGRLVALALSLQPAAHQVKVRTRPCRWSVRSKSTLLLPPMLGRETHVSSRCPVTGTEIQQNPQP